LSLRQREKYKRRCADRTVPAAQALFLQLNDAMEHCRRGLEFLGESRRSSSTSRQFGCCLIGLLSAKSWRRTPRRRGTQDEARELLEKIDTSTVIGLRERALIAMMIYTFGRVGAVIKMRIEDYYTQGRRGWVRLHEKGGKRHKMPCHHNLEAYLDAYIKAAGISEDFKGYLFRTALGKSGTLTSNPLAQSNVYRMIRRRAMIAGIKTRIGNHTFRATGITQYLSNGGRRELAQQMAAHESPRTTALYDRRDDEVAVDEVERILIL